MCLIGDAGAVIQPFTGSGVFKGYNNVKDLISALDTYSSLEEALQKWHNQQVLQAKRFLALGEQMEKALIWEQPDFSQMNAEEVAKWWKQTVQFPENFSYEK